MLRAFPYLNFKPGLLDAFIEVMVLQDNWVYQSRSGTDCIGLQCKPSTNRLALS